VGAILAPHPHIQILQLFSRVSSNLNSFQPHTNTTSSLKPPNSLLFVSSQPQNIKAMLSEVGPGIRYSYDLSLHWVPTSLDQYFLSTLYFLSHMVITCKCIQAVISFLIDSPQVTLRTKTWKNQTALQPAECTDIQKKFQCSWNLGFKIMVWNKKLPTLG
jgi:hypothetical protein